MLELETFKASREGYETKWDETRDKLLKRDEKRENTQKQLQTLLQDLEKAKYKRSVLGGVFEQQELQTFTVTFVSLYVNACENNSGVLTFSATEKRGRKIFLI